MEREFIKKIYVNGDSELVLILENDGKPEYQYVYRGAAGVYWDQEVKGFKSTPMKELSCSGWFTQIIEVVKSELGVELFLSPSSSWHEIPTEEIEKIRQTYDVK